MLRSQVAKNLCQPLVLVSVDQLPIKKIISQGHSTDNSYLNINNPAYHIINNCKLLH